MKVLGIRFCSVSNDAEALSGFFDALGLPKKPLDAPGTAGFPGAVFPAGTGWIEVWQHGPQLPSGLMLQIVVDDADAFAEHARANGLQPQGPTDAHGERTYFLKAPGGLAVTFQSAMAP